MLKLLSRTFIITILASFTLATAAGLTWLYEAIFETRFNLLFDFRIIAIAVCGLVAALLAAPVWRFFWKIPFLSSKVMPDLSGFWEVEIQSNHPIIEAMRLSGQQPGLRPDFLTVRFIGLLRQDWFESDLQLFGHDGSVLKSSETEMVEFRRGKKLGKPDIYWFYNQTNKRIGENDVGSFQGATKLTVKDSQLISGLTWTNRNYEQGLNTAGPVTLRKLEALPLVGFTDEKCRETVDRLNEKHIR